MQIIKFKLRLTLYIACILLSISSCKKIIEVNAPYTSFNGENVFTTDATAIAAVTSIYATMSRSNINVNGITSISFYAGLSADEISLLPAFNTEPARSHYKNSLTAISAPVFWNAFYTTIYQANAAVEGLSKSTVLTTEVKQQLLGESKFIRAFCYFYLVNFYGDVPLALSTDYKANSLMPRVASSQVNEQIISDLVQAKNLLNAGYIEADGLTSKANTERVRPNKFTAASLLARAYLFAGDYPNAEIQASEVINNTKVYNLTTLNNVFNKNNSEAIWQLQPVNLGWNTEDARVFILPVTGPNTSNYPAFINKRLLNSFEKNDLRKTSWLDSVKVGNDTFYYPHKYKSATLNTPVTEYNTVFRLVEQYLIRAEARAQQNNISGAQSDLNLIRNRAGLGKTPAVSQKDLITAILQEYRFEFFTEWGHRWLHLKRTGNIDSLMNIETPLKGGQWEPTDQFYPIPQNDLLFNPNLTQTLGYD
jgi:hypothetical protein